MRRREEIIAWRAHAPWANDAQIEQDLLLTEAMVAIFRDGFLREQVAMRGGTVLHKIHLAPAARYSEDIDLVLVGGRPFEHVERALVRVLEPLLGKPERRLWQNVRLAVRNAAQPSKIRRLVYRYAPTVRPPDEMKIKIEVNYSEVKPCYPVAHLSYRPPLADLAAGVEVQSYHLDEMLGTKMRALLQRNHGRDLFDLDRACLRLEAAAGFFDPGRTAAAFATYMRQEGSVFSRREYEQQLAAKCLLPAFRQDMAKVLAPGAAFDLDQAADRVRAVLISELG